MSNYTVLYFEIHVYSVTCAFNFLRILVTVVHCTPSAGEVSRNAKAQATGGTQSHIDIKYIRPFSIAKVCRGLRTTCTRPCVEITPWVP